MTRHLITFVDTGRTSPYCLNHRTLFISYPIHLRLLSRSIRLIRTDNASYQRTHRPVDVVNCYRPCYNVQRICGRTGVLLKGRGLCTIKSIKVLLLLDNDD